MGRPKKKICKERTDLTLAPGIKALGQKMAAAEGQSLSEFVEHLICAEEMRREYRAEIQELKTKGKGRKR